MKKVYSILLLAALAVMSGNAMAGNNCNKSLFSDCSSDNSVTTNNKGGDGGQGGTGVGIGIGKGGEGGTSNVGNGIGNLSPKAYGGDADADAAAYAKSIGINYNSLTTKQKTEVQTHVKTIQGQQQGQGQIGVVANVGPQVIITDKSVTTYEAAASSAIAPDVNAPAPSAGCRYSQGFSIAGSAVMAGGSIGHTTSEYDEICGAWQAARQTTGAAKATATTVAFCLSMEKADVDVAQCDGWRAAVAGKPASVEPVASATITDVSWGGHRSMDSGR